MEGALSGTMDKDVRLKTVAFSLSCRFNRPLFFKCSLQGVSRRSQAGGPSESLMLAPWSSEWRPHHPPRTSVNLAPLKLSSPETLRGALLVLEWSPNFFFLFSFFPLSFPLFSSLFLSLSFPFSSFWRPFRDPGAEAPRPPGYAPGLNAFSIFLT